jgi:hypothetical protein
LSFTKSIFINVQNYNYSGASERNSSFGFFGLAMCVGKKQICYGAVGFSFVLFSRIVIFFKLAANGLAMKM